MPLGVDTVVFTHQLERKLRLGEVKRITLQPETSLLGNKHFSILYSLPQSLPTGPQGQQRNHQALIYSPICSLRTRSPKKLKATTFLWSSPLTHPLPSKLTVESLAIILTMLLLPRHRAVSSLYYRPPHCWSQRNTQLGPIRVPVFS